MQKRWTVSRIEKRLHVLLNKDDTDGPEYKNLLRRLRTEIALGNKRAVNEAMYRRKLNNAQLVREKLPSITPSMSREEELRKINEFVASGKLEVLPSDC